MRWKGLKTPFPPPPPASLPPQKNIPNGWITEEIFLSFLRDVFIPHLGEKQPVVLSVAGHSSHHSLAIIILFISNAVLIVVNKT